MYERHFGFSERPFSIAPDPRFLYLSDSHRDALAHLLYGLNDEGGFVLLVGEVGTGKTTLVRSLLSQVPGHVDVAFLLNPRLDPVELLQSICDELHIGELTQHTSIKVLIDAINSHLLTVNSAGRSTVLLIDEAQNLSSEVLEQLRLLTNLETNSRKLFRIILIGQPELAAKLAKPELRQLSQRITARFRLRPLSRRQTKAYVKHRLAVASGRGRIFTEPALEYLHWVSKGIPRLINVMTDRALLGAYSKNSHTVDLFTMRQASKEVLAPQRRRWQWLSAAAIAVVVSGGAAWFGLPTTTPTKSVPASPTQHSIANVPIAETPTIIHAAAPDESDTDSRSIIMPPQPDNSALTSADESTLPDIITPPDPKPAAEAPPENGAAGDPPAPAPAPALTHPPPTLTSPPAEGLEWPAGVAMARSTDLAFAALFDRWQVPYERNERTACAYAQRVGLNCLFGVGNWTALTELNHPAILELQGPASAATYSIALLGIVGSEVEIVIGNRHERVSRDVIESQWRGKYTVLWQMPPGYRQPTDHSSSAETVAWLRSQLSKILGTDLGSGASFDQSLIDALKRFQAENSLKDDGVAGPRTWIAINQRAGLPVPRLKE